MVRCTIQLKVLDSEKLLREQQGETSLEEELKLALRCPAARMVTSLSYHPAELCPVDRRLKGETWHRNLLRRRPYPQV